MSKELVQAAKEYIDQNICSTTLNLEEVASHVYISRCHLSVIFRNHDIGFKNYVINKRIELAKGLLEQGASVTEACYRVGYSDLSHFSRSFKRKVGELPSLYLEKVRDDKQHTA